MTRFPQKKITTGQLIEQIRTASSFDRISEIHRDARAPQFHEALFEMMSAKGFGAKDMIRMTRIERAYFYHLLSGEKSPGRNIALRIGFSLRASLQDMDRLLRLAGVSELYARRRRDAVIIFAVTHRYDMDQANDLLIENGEDPLFIRT